jgi:hypothetical protein
MVTSMQVLYHLLLLVSFSGNTKVNSLRSYEEITTELFQVTRQSCRVPFLETTVALVKQVVRFKYLFKCVGEALHSTDEVGMQAN